MLRWHIIVSMKFYLLKGSLKVLKDAVTRDCNCYIFQSRLYTESNLEKKTLWKIS